MHIAVIEKSSVGVVSWLGDSATARAGGRRNWSFALPDHVKLT